MPKALVIQAKKTKNNVPMVFQMVIPHSDVVNFINDIAALSRVITPDRPNPQWQAMVGFNKTYTETVGETSFECDESLKYALYVIKRWDISIIAEVDVDPYHMTQLRLMNVPTGMFEAIKLEHPDWV